MANYDQLVWDIGAILPDETQVEICDWVMGKLREEGVDVEIDIPESEVSRARAEVYELFKRALNHKRYENERFPSSVTVHLCVTLEDTLTNMKPIKA